MPPAAPPHALGNTDFSVFLSCLVFGNMRVTVMFLQEYRAPCGEMLQTLTDVLVG